MKNQNDISQQSSPQPPIKEPLVPPKSSFHLKTFLLASAFLILLSISLTLIVKSLTNSKYQPPPIPISPTTSRPSPTSNPTANWQIYHNDEFGFEVRYPENWKLGEDNGPVLRSQAEYEYISIDSVPVKTGQEMIDVVIANTGMGECSPPHCRHPAEDEIFARNFDGNSFYYVFTNLFEGQLAVAYYVKNPSNDMAIRFWFFGYTGSENWPLRGDHDDEDEPDHSILKQILSTFRFVE